MCAVLKMKAPLVSVLMPMHNAALFVAAAVQSVLAQTVRELELIVVDDASTDASAEILRAIPDPRLRMIRSAAPLNAAGARNLALAEARGEFVAFLDADDLAERTRLSTQLRALRQPGIHLVASPVVLMDENGIACGDNFAPRPSEEIPATLLFENCLALSSVTARRAALQPFDPAFAPAEDYELWARLAPANGFHICAKALTRYRVHSGGVSARQPVQMRDAVHAIHAAQLARLGIASVPRIHTQLTAWPLQPSIEQLAEAEDWLLALRGKNDALAVYPPAIFRRVLAARWFALCMDSWSLGRPVWKKYSTSPLTLSTWRQRAQLLRRLLPLCMGKG